jgi:glycerol transport system ATP-binding protein
MGIVLDGVSKSFQGEPLVKNISLEVNDGDFSTLLGQTGAGKTTLLRIMSGIERPDSGRVIVDGLDVTGVQVRKRDVAMVYQQFINYPSMTVYENIASPLRVSKTKLSESEIDTKVRSVAELLNIGHVLTHYPQEVSGGQQQRTAIARALVKEASLILLDEPLANLDYKLREELRGELKRVFRERKGAIVYATPEPIDALAMGSHVGMMHQGDLLQYGPVEEVYKNPLTVEVGEYFSYPTMNMVPVQVKRLNGRVTLSASEELEATFPVGEVDPAKDHYLLGIHAYLFSTTPQHRDAIPIKAVVELSEVVGSDTELHVDHRGIKLVVLMQEIVRYQIGDAVDLFLDTRECFVYDQETRRLVAKAE